MRESFRVRAVPPKENANPMPVLFPDSFNRNNHNGQIRVRLGSFIGPIDRQLIYAKQGETFDYTDAIDTKGVRS